MPRVRLPDLEGPELVRLNRGRVEVSGSEPGPGTASRLELKREIARRAASSCSLCAWACGVDRARGEHGRCGLGAGASPASPSVHAAEEALINPSLLVPVRGCALRCRGCQQSPLLAPAAEGPLLVGPPGTGKSLSAREIGRITGDPVIDFRIASLMNSLVGATENNFLHATRALDAMAPCVVFIDEVEKALAGGAGAASTDGGVMARSHGILLIWLNDSRSPVYVVGTANHLDRMEDWRTFARRGRFDDVFFVDVPGPGARMEILRRELPGLDGATLVALSRSTAGFSGADLARVCRQARVRAATSGDVAARLADEGDQMSHQVAHALRDFARLRTWARDNSRPASSELEET